MFLSTIAGLVLCELSPTLSQDLPTQAPGHFCKIDLSFLYGHEISLHHSSPSGFLIFLFTYCSGHVMQMVSCRLSRLQSNCIPSHIYFPLPGVYLETMVLLQFLSARFALVISILRKTSRVLQNLIAFL